MNKYIYLILSNGYILKLRYDSSIDGYGAFLYLHFIIKGFVMTIFMSTYFYNTSISPRFLEYNLWG